MNLASTPVRIAAVVAAAAAALPLALAAPASAATRTLHDGAGEAGVPPYADILAVTVHNDAKSFSATISLTKVKPVKTSVGLLIVPLQGESESEYAVGTTATGSSHHPTFVRYDRDGTKKVHCPGLDVVVDPQKDRVRISFPQTCLQDAAGKLSVVARSKDTSGGYLDRTHAFAVKRG